MAPPERRPRRPAQRDQAAAGIVGPRQSARGAPTVRYGVLPLEDTAQPCAVSPDFTATRMGRGFAGGLPCQASRGGDQPFASLPFAHPIPQSRLRASGDLFSASLKATMQKIGPRLFGDGSPVRSIHFTLVVS